MYLHKKNPYLKKYQPQEKFIFQQFVINFADYLEKQCIYEKKKKERKKERNPHI